MKPEILLNRAGILVEPDEPQFVQRGVRDLAAYLREITGADRPVGSSPADPGEAQIIVGSRCAEQQALRLWADRVRQLGAEGFLIWSAPPGAERRVIVAGATAQGTKFGLFRLMRLIEVAGGRASVPARLEIVSRPSFPVRGLHLNGWAINYPYTFRCWTEADWCRYIDLVASQGVNLFFIWPFLEIMPVPFSAEDESYLQEVRRVVDYAQRERGLEVWIFQSPNRVAVNDCGVRDPRHRPYWVLSRQGRFGAAGQVDLDPSDPDQLAAILRAREALYRIVNNADGYCTIDSDPGGWRGSALDAFMRIFQESRKKLDALTVRGPATKQIHWLWQGWGQDRFWERTPEQQQPFIRETIRAMKRAVPEPWWLIAGYRQYLPACAAEDVLAKTVHLPYNGIEYEPSRPGTQHNFPQVRQCLDAVEAMPGIAGVMGNAQTPLLQFPHVSYFLDAAWDFESRRRAPADVLRDLAGLVYPEQREALADGWAALEPSGRERIEPVTERLAGLTAHGQLGRPGVLGRNLFPEPSQIADDLVAQLRGWAGLEKLRRGSSLPADDAEWVRQIEFWLDAALAWDRRHGWSAYWLNLGKPWPLLPDEDPAVGEMVAHLRRQLGSGSVAAFLEPIGRRLAARYDPEVVQTAAIAPLAKLLSESK